MPDAEGTRKRSRSPSDSDAQQQSSKRPNTGVEPPPRVKAEEDHVSTTAPPFSAGLPDPPSSAVVAASEQADSALTGGVGDTPVKPEPGAPAPMGNISMRCLIVTQDASIIIGKAGAHVNEIREKSNARVTVSESLPGNPERILNVTGPLDAVSKAFGLIVRRINDEPFDQPSVPGSRAVTIKFMIFNSRMGSVIGKAGSKIKEIQEASGAKLNASEGMLPGSTEVGGEYVFGVADAIHIATYYIGNILIEANDRHPPTTRELLYRPTANSTRRPGPGGGYEAPPPPPPPAPYGGYPPPMPQHHMQQHPYGAPPMPPPAPGPLQTQNLYIPQELVGSIIGKGGAKINEVRALSGATIKIMEAAPGATETERLVVITGAPPNIQMAVSMLYTRLEQEKQKQLRQQL